MTGYTERKSQIATGDDLNFSGDKFYGREFVVVLN